MILLFYSFKYYYSSLGSTALPSIETYPSNTLQPIPSSPSSSYSSLGSIGMNLKTSKKMRGLMCHSPAATAVCIPGDPRSVIVPRRPDRTLVDHSRLINNAKYSRLGESHRLTPATKRSVLVPAMKRDHSPSGEPMPFHPPSSTPSLDHVFQVRMLKAHKKGIRRATVNTFGYIAKAIGPQDVLAILLNNLKVQERQNRVCTTVDIAIVAETCSPFTDLPALMNEYRVPELNVQNGVLKSLSFLFEYIGEMGKDYIYAMTPLLEDALMDRDLVHRQTAASAVKHMALGVAGLGCEDALVHLLNYVWANIFETSPHVINVVMEAIEGMRVALGAAVVLNYCLQGLFHPARKVREVYWKIYNSLYIGSQDALVAAYPLLDDEQNNIYSRPELVMFI